MKLSFATYGEGAPLIILHGVFGSGRNWAAMAKAFAAEGWQAITVDLRNHGGSPHATKLSYPDMVSDVRTLIADQGYDQPVVIGHSMGGKVAMGLALETPDLLRALIVVDIAPVEYPHGNTALVAAMQALDVDGLKSRRDADKALKEAVSNPGIRAFLLHNLLFEQTGPRWQLNLDAIGAAMPSLMKFPFDPEEPKCEAPVLFLAGEESDYMRDVDRSVLRDYFPTARLARVKGAGHWVHAEAPDAFREIVLGFLGTLSHK